MSDCLRIAYRHIRKRTKRFCRFFMKMEICLCLALFALVQFVTLVEGQFYSLTFLILVFPVFFFGLHLFIFLCRVALNTRLLNRLNEQGYLVNLTEYLNCADEDTVRMLSNLYQIRQQAEDLAFLSSFYLTPETWFRDSKCFSFIDAEYFKNHIEKWKASPDFDLTNDMDIMRHSIFFVFDDDLAEKTEKLCTNKLNNQNRIFAISSKCEAIYTSIKGIDMILLDVTLPCKAEGSAV